MALKGRLEDFGITQLLNLINLARKTGTLYLEGAQKNAYLCFREGKLIYAAVEGMDDSLPAILQRASVFTPEQVRMIQTNMPGKSDREIAQVLITSGRLQQQIVVKSVRDYVLDLVYQIFSWTDGQFRFEPSKLPVQGKITTSIALENVIMEGSRRVKEWERLQDELPDLDVPLKFAERPTTPLRDVNLSVEEWRVISFVNPNNTIRQIAQFNNMGELQIRKIVYSLLQAGLVEIVRPPRPTGAPATAAPGHAAATGTPASAPPTAVLQRPAVKRGIIQKLIGRIKEL
ncbi:MAG TPA: DUF4388 domain-containing protein [Anaerolineae bacterium]|nr:DUF4388 domain-containing protein [Anaerolineae bacterium]HQK12375.1 DUF4388 domain-containing protein [Anaerolineae bacterium]